LKRPGPPDNESTSIFIEAPSGERFEADVPRGTRLSKLAADFFESQGWPMQDARGRGQRAVVELVDPEDPDETKRLNGDDEIENSGVRDGDTLRVFPESIAGVVVDQRARLRALTVDQQDMLALCERNSKISFSGNRANGPDRYEVTFRYTSFVSLSPGEAEPRKADTHRVEIILGADYPRRAPLVRWLTPVFHPNIRQLTPPDPERGHGLVCLGVLQDRYLPGGGLARLVRMLAEMIQWRNFDAFNPFNMAAARWAANMDNWPLIEAIDGHPIQGPITEFFEKMDREMHPPIEFKPVSSDE